jgi:DNA-binding LacI/PurR family transcriptional regulator
MVVTIKQIAELAGVSISTVSRIINSHDNSFASKEVRDRVWAIIQEHDYVPNQHAKNLKQNYAGQNTVYSSIICVLGRAKDINENPFFEQVARAVEQRSLSMEATVSQILTSNHEPSPMDKKSGNAIVIGRVQEAQIKWLEQQYKNIVYIGRNQLDVPFDQIICDGREATEKAMELLIKNGHKHIAYFGETTNEVRFRAYIGTIKKMAAVPYVFDVPHTAEGGYSAAEQMLKESESLPTAVFCASDTVAIAAMRRFREAKVKIPENISVIGMDNIELAAYVSPMLTTIEMPAVEMGNIAVSILLDRVNKGHKIPIKIILPSKLIERESVARTRMRFPERRGEK